MLTLTDVHTYYGYSHVLQGISLSVARGEVVGILGRNGAGKTTTLHSIIGFVTPRQGEVRFDGQRISGRPPHWIARQGIALVPQGRRLFGSLSVHENLLLGARRPSDSYRTPWNLERIHAFFPILAERAHVRATALSGGEQQMLAISRALLTNPQLVLMDEPSEGLAPAVVERIGDVILRLKEDRLAVLLVEQSLDLALRVCDRIYILSKGVVVYEGMPHHLVKHVEILRRFLGV